MVGTLRGGTLGSSCVVTLRAGSLGLGCGDNPRVWVLRVHISIVSLRVESAA